MTKEKPVFLFASSIAYVSPFLHHAVYDVYFYKNIFIKMSNNLVAPSSKHFML